MQVSELSKSNDSNLRPLLLEDCQTVAEFRVIRDSFSGQERAAFYQQLEQVLLYSRHHYIDYEGKQNEREDLQELRAKCLGSREFEEEHLEFLFCLYVLRMGRLGLEQVKGHFGLPAIRRLVQGRLELYDLHGSPKAARALATAKLGWGARANLLYQARVEVDEQYYRVSLIDGKAWYRTEALLPRSVIASTPPADGIALALAEWSGLSLEQVQTREDEAIRLAVGRCLDRHGALEPLLSRVLQAIVDDERVPLDNAVLTCPAGLRLDEPGELGEQQELKKYFRCYTVYRTGLECPEALPEKVTSSARKAITGRMFRLKQKAVKNCFHAGPLAGVDIEKAYDYMVYANEDTHYPGHKVARVFTGGRSPIRIRVPERNLDLPLSMCDLRCFRGREQARLFTVDEERFVIRAAELLQVMLCETFRLNGLVSVEEEEA